MQSCVCIVFLVLYSKIIKFSQKKTQIKAAGLMPTFWVSCFIISACVPRSFLLLTQPADFRIHANSIIHLNKGIYFIYSNITIYTNNFRGKF